MPSKILKNKKIAFIGAGNMANACITGFIDKKSLQAHDIFVYDIDSKKYANYIMRGVNCCDELSYAVSNADYIVLAVKPQHISSALDTIRENGLCMGRTFISFAAGISTEYISSRLSSESSVIRTMPNTPFLIGKGTIAVSPNSFVSRTDIEAVCTLFSTIAEVTLVDESLMNAVISLNGSSPAYIFRFYKAMCDAAREMGFKDADARNLILSTFEGSVAMLRANPDTEQMIKNVTSPNGTTQASLEQMDRDDFDGVIKRCMDACTARAEELSEQ